MTLLSAPKAEASKCLKPRWCDHQVGDDSGPKYRAWFKDRNCTQVYSSDDERRYCSTACRDRAKPSPPATAEAKRQCTCAGYCHCDAAIGPDAKPATAEKGPVAVPAPFRRQACGREGRGYVECDGAVVSNVCDAHDLFAKLSKPGQAKHGGLIDRRLAHSHGIEDPALEDC
jgi:hypothetical protein